MNTSITQPSYIKPGWKLLPVLLVAILAFCARPADAQTWTLGTGTSQYSATGTATSPLGYYYPNARAQYMYTKAELNAVGLIGPMTLHQIAFNVGNLNAALGPTNYTISLTQTSLTALASNFVNTGLVPMYYSAGGYGPTTGWNTITFNQGGGAFSWNGNDNIIVDICYTTGGTSVGASNFAGVFYNSISGRSVFAYSTSTSSLCGNPGGTALSYRPNIRFTHLDPCIGTPGVVTTNPSGTISTLCPGSSVTIAGIGYTPALGLRFQWWSALTATGPWSHARGDSSSDRYTTPPLISNTYYRLVVTCTNTGDSSVTPVVGFTFPGGFPVYGAIPYFEGFENWSNGCATKDKVSSNNWTNYPITGDASWRREDDGATASWYSPTSYAAAPPYEGLHSARHHSYVPTAGNEGALSLYVNASATTGNKDLSFWYRMNYGSSTNYDSLNVDMSTDGGTTFTNIAKLGNASGPFQTWNYRKYNIATTSATTVIRFRSKALTTYHDDVYIDAVQIDAPCGTKPTAGVIDTIIACSGKPFTMKLNGSTTAAGLSYLWQYKPAGSSVWSPLPGGTVATPTATITSATDFRAIVTCTYSIPNLSDTTPVYNAGLAPFYYCYCGVSISSSYAAYNYMILGNTTLKTEPAGATLINNGNPLPTIGNLTTNVTGYEDFRRTVAAPTLVRDSTYRLLLTQTEWQTYFYTGAYAVAWLDENRNGTFDTYERIMFKTIPSQTNPTASQVFTISSSAPVGLTGLRVATGYYYSVPGFNPCGQLYAYGQFEDYLVKLEYNPCTGPVDPGTAWASDTAVCRGYTVDLYDTSYERSRTNILRMWEVSTNGGASFAAIPGSAQKDTMKNVTITGTSQYRLRAICGITNDTTYSNVVSVRAPEPVRCYPTSWAFPGGGADSSDIGSFVLGNFINPSPGVPAGPHLLNPAANKRRSDFTLMPAIELNADSTYRIAVFHTMPRGFHGDALVSVYMDFNNDLDYDLNVPPAPFTSELIFQGVSRFDSFFLDTKITIPHAVIPNVPTGMRVIINNDVNPYGSGNTGSGVFTSGEVEDYIVIFRRTPLSTGGVSLLQNLALYPNPTEGKFTVLSDAARAVNHLDVVVSTITGQQVISRSFDNVGTHFSTDLDLSTQAKGIYFVKIRADGEKITKKLIVR